jgi:hypothetical protein
LVARQVDAEQRFDARDRFSTIRFRNRREMPIVVRSQTPNFKATNLQTYWPIFKARGNGELLAEKGKGEFVGGNPLDLSSRYQDPEIVRKGKRVPPKSTAHPVLRSINIGVLNLRSI